MNSNNKPFSVLIELPNWLGDCVMSTPAIENIINYYKQIEITLLGPQTSIEIIENNPKVIKVITIDSRHKYSFKHFYNLGFFDAYFSFRGSVRSKVIKYFINANDKYQFNNNKFPGRHQVQKYVDFVNHSLNSNFSAGKLSSYKKHSKKLKKNSRVLGINPGASYGSAKRWYPEQFAKVAKHLSSDFDIIIFGGTKELDFASEIEKYLFNNNINNYLNLAGKTSVYELTRYISTLDIFITGDSGPMHIAASLQIPTIALFGPTNPNETSQWKNPKGQIIKKTLDCQPCMKRTCPLKHHNCMKLISANEVINSISLIN